MKRDVGMGPIITDRHTFEIVDTVPEGYGIWNIPRIHYVVDYLPLYDLNAVVDGKVDTSTLKAIRCYEGFDDIRRCAGWGLRTLELCKQHLNLPQEGNITMLERQQAQVAQVGYPFMQKVPGL